MDFGSLQTLIVVSLIPLGTAFLTWRLMRSSGALPVQQATVDNLNKTVDALQIRVGLLEGDLAHKEEAHTAEITELRGQFQKSLAQKDLRIRDLERSLADLKQQHAADMTDRDARISVLETDLAQARTDLAAYAQAVLPALRRRDRDARPDGRTRTGDTGTPKGGAPYADLDAS